MKVKNICFTLFILLCCACDINEEVEDKDVIIEDKDNLLLGIWVTPVYDQETTTFTRGVNLPEEGYGISFKQNETLVERTSGFCGTPPLTFFNVEGTFTLENDLVTIRTSNFSSPYLWRIIELTEEKLVVKRELSEQEKEHRTLMNLYNEIYNIAYSNKCSNSNDWSFVAYGSKACGGPQGFIPYHKSIDVASFLEKVEAYSNAEKAFNIKWNIVSDCAVSIAPKSVDCQNGLPVLKY